VGYDEDGAKVLKLFPEGRDLEPTPVTPEDIPVVDKELSLTSDRPVQNQAITRALFGLKKDCEHLHEIVEKSVEEWFDESDEKLKEEVDRWLAVHPEATTTVQDHSLTIDKMVNGTLGYVTPEMFGAKGDGITDDREAFLNMLCSVPENTVILCGADKKYKINGIVWVQNRHHVTILNAHFLLKDSESIGTVFQIREKSSHITFRDCTFVGGAQVIHLFECNNITVDNCTFIESGYAIIQQNGYVSNNVFVTNNFAQDLANDFVECNCESNAPSKNWVVTGNIFTRSELPSSKSTESRFLGATRIENIVITDNVVENVKGDACVHLENIGGSIVVSNNVFKNSMGTGYVYIMHYGKKTIITNNHFVNEIEGNNTAFIYIYAGENQPALDVIVSGNVMTGNGTQNMPINWSSSTTENKMITNNIIKGIGAMFSGAFTIQKWFFSGNIVECTEFFNMYDSTHRTRRFNDMDFINNVITGDVALKSDGNGGVSKNIRFTGNRVKGNLVFEGAKDVFVSDNVIEQGYTFTFSPTSWNAERMYQNNNYIVGTGLYNVTA
jgi:hypothetical protein